MLAACSMIGNDFVSFLGRLGLAVTTPGRAESGKEKSWIKSERYDIGGAREADRAHRDAAILRSGNDVSNAASCKNNPRFWMGKISARLSASCYAGFRPMTEDVLIRVDDELRVISTAPSADRRRRIK